MSTDLSRVVVNPGARSQGFSVNHRDFAEIRADGSSPVEAALHLVNQLDRALDSALTDWRRQALNQAIADVQAFVASAT